MPTGVFWYGPVTTGKVKYYDYYMIARQASNLVETGYSRVTAFLPSSREYFRVPACDKTSAAARQYVYSYESTATSVQRSVKRLDLTYVQHLHL